MTRHPDDDTVWPDYDQDRYGRTPRRHTYQGNPTVSARFDPEALARLDHFALRTGLDRTAIIRNGVQLIITGYPALPPDVHDWLLRLAAANGCVADPQAALELLVRHLAARRPAAGVLRH